MKLQSLVGFQTPTHLCLYWRNTSVWLNDCVRKSKALQARKPNVLISNYWIWQSYDIKNDADQEAHNTLFDLHNSSYHNEPSLMIVLLYSFKYFQLQQEMLTSPVFKALPVFLGSFRLWRDFSSRKFSSNSSCHPFSVFFAIFARFQGSISAIFLRITCKTVRHFFQLGQTAEQPSPLLFRSHGP